MKKRVIVQGLIRGGITLVVMSVITYFVNNDKGNVTLREMIAATIISTAVAGFTSLYEYDVWSTKKKITVHSFAMLFTVYPALIYSGWFGHNYLVALAVFVATGMVFASIGYLVSKYVLKNITDPR